jgi:hypothetical protein
MLRQSVVLMMLFLAPTAQATETVINSEAPYWEVGPRDQNLSRACATQRFNERQPGRYVVRLHAKKGGAAVLGVAKGNGFNLIDLDHMAVVTEDYFFRDDATSNCEVFVGRAKPPVDGTSAPPP